MLTNSYVIAILVPFLFLFCGSLAKKLSRGQGWQTRDFYLGIEFTLSGLSSATINIFDVIKTYSQNIKQASQSQQALLSDQRSEDLTATGVYIATTICLLLVIMTIHQEFENKPNSTKQQIFWLCIFANFLGAGILAAFILQVKGI